MQYRSGSRTPSPTHSTLLAEDLSCPHKDSLTPDRDSLHIDMVANHADNQDRGKLLAVDNVTILGIIRVDVLVI